MTKFLRGLAAPIMASLAISFAVPAYAQVVHVAGSDGSTYREVGVDTTGALKTVGAQGATFGSGSLSPTSVYTAVGGSDGANGRILRTDVSGNLFTVGQGPGSANVVGGNVASGATDSGNPAKIGGVYNSTLPTFTTGQRGDAQLDSKGALVVTLKAYGSSNPMQSLTPSNGLTLPSNVIGITNFSEIYNGTTADLQTSIVGALANGTGTTAVAVAPTNSTNAAITPVVSASVGSNLVLKAGTGNLYRVTLVAGASAGFLMVFNATAAPADGAVTPQICRPVAANGVVDVLYDIPNRFSTGITAVFSTTGCFTKTASATAYVEGLVE